MANCTTCDTCSPVRAKSAKSKWLHALAAFVFFCASVPNTPLLAQGLESEDAIDAIVGSDVKTEETRAKADTVRIVSAIANTRENAERVRKTFNLDELEIVFVPDIGEEESAIDDAIAKNKDEVEALHEAIEGGALFYHAVNSRSIMMRDVIAMEYKDNNRVTIFVSGSPSDQ